MSNKMIELVYNNVLLTYFVFLSLGMLHIYKNKPALDTY